jgi:hypothetical protein
MTASENLDIASAIKVVAGNPSSTELAAIVAVLSESAKSKTQSVKAEPNWARGSDMLRGTQNSGVLEWRSDFKGKI